MILGVVCGAGFLFAWAMGADLSRLGAVRLRWTGLIFAAFALQLAVFTSLLHVPVLATHEVAVHLASYCCLLVFAARNARLPGFAVAALGLLSNTIVIFANGGRMPIGLHTWEATGESGDAIARSGSYNNNVLADAHTHLRFLGDVFPLPAGTPLANTLSIGDLLLLAGATFFVYRSCSDRSGSALRGVVAPLRVGSFRALLAARTVSKLGDWLSLAALVTWTYSRTHSGFWVSALLLTRVGASIAGSVAAAPLIDRFPRRRTLAAVEVCRGVCMALLIVFALGGHLALVAAALFASCFVSAATDPNASSLVPELLRPDLVHAGNALHAISRSAMMALGAVLGGVLAARLGLVPALALDVCTFAAAALCYSLPAPERLARTEPREPDEPARIGRVELARSVARRPALLALVASFALATAAMGLLNASLAAFLAARVPGAGGYGVAIGLIGVGLMAGELLCGLTGESNVVRRAPALGFAVSGTLVALLSQSHVVTTALLLLLLLGVADGSTETAYDTIVQDIVPPRLHGAVFSFAGALQQSAMVAGLAAAPFLARFSPETPLRASVVAAFAAAIVALGVIVARPARREAPAAPPAPPVPSRAPTRNVFTLGLLLGAAPVPREERDELSAHLLHLRGFATLDGELPEAFDELIAQVFGRLVATAP